MYRKNALPLTFLFYAQLFFYVAASVLPLSSMAQTTNIELISGPTLTMDPHGAAPLVGVVAFETNVPVQVTLNVRGMGASWTVEFPEFAAVHNVLVLGLKPESTYDVDVLVQDASGTSMTVGSTMRGETGPLHSRFPFIEVDVSKPEKMAPGYILLDRNGDFTIIVDRAGDVVGIHLKVVPSPLGCQTASSPICFAIPLQPSEIPMCWV